MAQASGLSVSSVRRIWRAFGLQPHRTETFKLSCDPLFVDKVRDVVGLYAAPPSHAVVLCADEKSQIRRGVHRSVPSYKLRSKTSSITTTPIQSRSEGPNPPIRSSRLSSTSVLETRETLLARTFNPGH